MKILNKDIQHDILVRIAAMQIMVDHIQMPIEWYEKFCEHLSSIAFDVSDTAGVENVQNIVKKIESKEKEEMENAN